MLITDRLLLRRPRLADVEVVYAYRSLPQVARHLAAGIWSQEKTRSELATYERAQFMEPGDEIVLLVETLTDHEVIGEVGLVWLSQAKVAEVGYVFNPRHGGHGYASEAVKAAVAAAFSRWGFDRIIAKTDEANVASRALCARIGMTLESTSPTQDDRHVLECTYVLMRPAD